MSKIFSGIFLLIIFTLFLPFSAVKANFDISPKTVSINVDPGDIFKQVFVINSDRENAKFRAISIYPEDTLVSDWRILSVAKNTAKMEVTILVPVNPMKDSYDFVLDIYDSLSDDAYRVNFNVEISKTKNIVKNFHCIDSDDGKNIRVFGTAKNNAGWQKDDICINKNLLKEFYCEEGSGRVLSQNFVCVGQCQNGKCIDKIVPVAHTSKNSKNNSITSSRTLDEESPKKRMNDKKSYMVFYINIFLIFFGFLITKYANYVQKTDGGVSLYQRLVGPFIIFASIFSIIIFFSIDSSLFLMFSFIVFIIKLIISTNKNVNELYSAKMKKISNHNTLNRNIKNRYYNKPQ